MLEPVNNFSSIGNHNRKTYTLCEQEIMDKLAIVVLQSFPSLDVFSLKGGWVLSKIFPNEFRRTVDVDLSITDVKHFTTLIDSLETECQNLVNLNEIHSYKILTPNPDRHRSGGIKLYRLRDDGKKYKVSGVDVSVKCLDSCVVILNEYIPVFSFERMLADKLSVLFSSSFSRRMKDVFDARLIIERCTIDRSRLIKFCSNANVDFKYPDNIFCKTFNQLEGGWSDFIIKCSPLNYQDLEENLIIINNFIKSLGVIENE